MKLYTVLRMTYLPLVAAFVAVLGMPPPAKSETAAPRAPYLQDDRGNAITVCWTTLNSRATQAWFRPASGGSTRTARLSGYRRQHQLTFSNLRFDTDYRYRVNADSGATAWFTFRTRPDPEAEDEKPFTFAAWGDVGRCGSKQREVIEVLEEEDPEFAVALGDLGYPTASEVTLSNCFFRPLARYASSHVVWHVFGNHDVAALGGRPLEAASATPANGPKDLPPHRNYSFNYGSAHFVVIDSNLSESTLRKTVQPWLVADLRASTARWKFAFMHHPPYNGGRHGDTRRIQRTLVPVFAREGVDIVFAGHDHNYQRFHPINDVTYVVSGNGATGLYRFRSSEDDRVAKRQDRRHGITFLDVDGDRAVLRHVEYDGDEFDKVELAPRSAGEE